MPRGSNLLVDKASILKEMKKIYDKFPAELQNCIYDTYVVGKRNKIGRYELTIQCGRDTVFRIAQCVKNMTHILLGGETDWAGPLKSQGGVKLNVKLSTEFKAVLNILEIEQPSQREAQERKVDIDYRRRTTFLNEAEPGVGGATFAKNVYSLNLDGSELRNYGRLTSYDDRLT